MMSIPPELLNCKPWVLWRKAEVNGRATKIPISPWSGRAAASDQPRTWSTYRHVRHVRRSYQCDGIGFVFTEEDPFCGIDLDQCRSTDGTIQPEALELIQRLDSYTELSPSGTGVHILIKANLSGKGRRSGQIEIYDCGRYFTVTGNHLPGSPLVIESRQKVLDQIGATLFSPALSSPIQVFSLPIQVFSEAREMSDDKLVRWAQNARNGERFQRLWAGDASDYDNDHSRADLALCWALAYWCGRDPERMDRLFRRSGLMREKWDRSAGGVSYGALTIRTALHKPPNN